MPILPFPAWKLLLLEKLSKTFIHFQSLWDRLPQELKVYIHRLEFGQLKHDLKGDENRQELLQEIRDYFALKHAWGRSGIQVIRVNDLYIYGFFDSRSRKDRMLLGFDYKEELERVLKYY